MRFTEEMIAEDEKRWHARDIVTELRYCSSYMRDRRDITNLDIRFYAYIMRRAHEMLKAQEPRLLTSKDFSNSPITDTGGAIPCWKESKSPTRRSGWAVIVYGRWLADTENGSSRYWTSRPTDTQREATPWP